MELAVGGLAESERSESGSAHEGMVPSPAAFIYLRRGAVMREIPFPLESGSSTAGDRFK